MNLDSTNYVEFHADTWDYGYTLWLDGLQFSPCDPPLTGITVNNNANDQELTNYPNPFSGTTEIAPMNCQFPVRFCLKVYDFLRKGNSGIGQ